MNFIKASKNPEIQFQLTVKFRIQSLYYAIFYSLAPSRHPVFKFKIFN